VTAAPQLAAALAKQCSARPGDVALASAKRRTTYGALWATAETARRRLDSMGLVEGSRVAVSGGSSPEAIALLLACLSSGRPALVVPPDLRAHPRDELLRRAGVEQLLDPVELTQPPASISRRHGPLVHSRPEDHALLLTTSGSTGAPKLVPLSHGAITHFMQWARRCFEISRGTPVLSYASLSFDLAMLEVWTTLAAGGCVVLADRERAAQGRHLFELIDAHAVEVVQGLPALYRLLIDAAASRDRGAPSVRHAIVTGDVAPARCLAALPALLPRSRFYNVYGCTETNDSFIHELKPPLMASELGSPLPSVDALVVHEGSVLDGPGQGELWVSTPFQTTGYLGASAMADRFARQPFGRSGTYFRTGDLVRRDESGAIFLQGRTDREVKVRGVRVNLEAVEQALLDAPNVMEAVVVARTDLGAERRLHAVVRGCAGSELSALRLRSHCASRLSPAAIPPVLHIVDRPLPRTSTGKLDRRRVERDLEGSPTWT
jgi:acyl-coenzyme A synthetase/AMP-(fatty) acid ligase